VRDRDGESRLVIVRERPELRLDHVLDDAQDSGVLFDRSLGMDARDASGIERLALLR